MKFWTKRKLKAFEGWKRSVEENKVFIINEVDYEKFMEKYVDENEVADVLRKIVDDVVVDDVDVDDVDVDDVVVDDVVVDDVDVDDDVDKKMIYLDLKSSLLFFLCCILWFCSYSGHESLELVEKEQQRKGISLVGDFLRGLCCRINSHLPHCVSTNKI
mgnify:CR=1 FL=1